METARTSFSELDLNDFNEIFDLYNDKEVRKYLGGITTKSEFEEKFKRFCTVQSPECFWVIRQKGTKRFIGIISITKHHDQKHLEISYQLHPDFWKKGFGTEIVKKGINYAFENIGFDELYAETQKKNLKSIKLLEKIGMRPVTEIDRFGEQQIIYSIKNPR